MKRKLQSVGALTLIGAVLGCAQTPPQISPHTTAHTKPGGVPVKVAAVVPGAPAVASAAPAEALFGAGRNAHAAGQLETAAARYEQVLALNAEHVGALNALAVIHAQAHRTDAATALFNRALQLSPQAAHLHNNKGYALLRAGRLVEAGNALRQANALDPANSQTIQNLQLLAAQVELSAPALAQAAAHSAPQALYTAQTGPSPGHQLVAVAPNVLEFRPPTAPPQLALAQAQFMAPVVAPVVAPVLAPVLALVAPPVAPPTAVSAPEPLIAPVQAALSLPTDNKPPSYALKGIRLEVANGVGISNLARRTAQRLASTGLIATRLTNVKPYRQATTEIQYVAGQAAAAQALSASLPATTQTVAAERLERGVQIRLVLGHDAASKAIAAWLDGTQLAQEKVGDQALDSSAQGESSAAPQGGWILV